MKKNINLYSVYKQKQTQKKSAGSFLSLFAIVLIVSLIVGALGLRLMIDNARLADENQTLISGIEASNQSGEVAKVKEGQSKITVLETLKDNLSNAQGIVDKKNNLNQELIDSIYKQIPSGVMLDSLTIQLPTVQIEVTFNSQKDLNNYINNLKTVDGVLEITSTVVTRLETGFFTQIVIIMGGTY